MKRVIIPIAISLTLGGCAIPSRNRPTPAVPVAATWSLPPTNAVAEVGQSWWDQFGDPELVRLIREAIESNADLAMLTERVELARADGRFATANARPSAMASTGMRAGKKHTRVTGFQTESVRPWSAGGALGWELDWLGKWRDRSDAAKASVRASEADLNAGRLLMAAEVATAWFQYRRYRAEIGILKNSLKRQREILTIYRDRFQAGILETSVVERQEAEAADLERRQVRARMLAEIQARRLNRLRGLTASAHDYPVQPPDSRAAIPTLPDTLPADVLRRRPDLAAAEARLQAAFSLERAARLDLFPSLSLKLTGTTASGSLTDPFQSWISEAGPRLDLPIWDPERLARSRVHGARARVAAAEYRTAALRAVEDVEVALVQFHYRQAELKLAKDIVGKTRRVREITDDKRRAGIVSQLEVLEDERRTLTAELNELAIHTEALTDAVAVYRAMAVTEAE